MGGAGYDLINNDIFSVPLFFGAQVQYYSAELVSDPVSWTDVVTYNVDMKTSGSGFLYGASGGIAVSAKIYDMIKVTPYFIYLHNFNSAEMQSDIKLENPALPLLSVKSEVDLDVDPVSAGMLGLNIGLVSDSGFSFSVALGSMITSLAGHGSKSSENGVEMKSIVLIAGYDF